MMWIAISFHSIFQQSPTVTSDKNSKLITTIKDVASSYVDKDDIFVSALVGATDACSFLG